MPETVDRRRWGRHGCHGHLLSTGPDCWMATCHVHAWRGPDRTGGIAQTAAFNDARIHADASTSSAYPGMLDTSSHDGTRGKDTPMTHDTSEATPAPTVAVTTEYGIRTADGGTVWQPRSANGNVTIATGLAEGENMFTIASGDMFIVQAARAALEALARKTERAAKAAGLPYTEDAAPRLVGRRVTTLTDAPFDVLSGIPSSSSVPVEAPFGGFDF